MEDFFFNLLAQKCQSRVSKQNTIFIFISTSFFENQLAIIMLSVNNICLKSVDVLPIDGAI